MPGWIELTVVRTAKSVVAARLRSAGARLADGSDPGDSGRASERAVRLLEALGGAVEVEEGRKHFVIRGLACPVGRRWRSSPGCVRRSRRCSPAPSTPEWWSAVIGRARRAVASR